MQYARKIVAFDAFGTFPADVEHNEDKEFIKFFSELAGDGIDIDILKNICNVELYKGNVFETLPLYI